MPMPVLAFCYVYIPIFRSCLSFAVNKILPAEARVLFSSPKLPISEAKPGSYSICSGSLPLGIKWLVPEASELPLTGTEVERLELCLYALCMLSCSWQRQLHFCYTKFSAELFKICENWLARSCTTHKCQAVQKYFILLFWENIASQQYNNWRMNLWPTYLSLLI